MIIEKLRKIYVDITEKDAEGFTPESRLIEDLEMDSITVLYMAVAIEEQFGITVDNELVNNIKTVADMVCYIEARK